MRVLDAGALIALDRGDRDAWALLGQAYDAGQRPVVPAPVVAQAWRSGRRQARLARALLGCEALITDAPVARRAGELLGRANTSDVLDALVALAAQDRPGWEILTSEPEDIHHLLSTLGLQRAIRVV